MVVSRTARHQSTPPVTDASLTSALDHDTDTMIRGLHRTMIVHYRPLKMMNGAHVVLR